MLTITPEETLHLARLSRLELTGEEQERYASQLSSVVGYIDQLSKVDTSTVDVLKGVTGLQNVLGADELRSEGDACVVSREELLGGAPASEDGFIVVRAVMGEEGGGA